MTNNRDCCRHCHWKLAFSTLRHPATEKKQNTTEKKNKTPQTIPFFLLRVQRHQFLRFSKRGSQSVIDLREFGRDVFVVVFDVFQVVFEIEHAGDEQDEDGQWQ